jgi:hypothetical protein
MTERPPRPIWTGIGIYRDPQGRFGCRYPMDWHQFELDPGREGVLFSPQSANPQTFISVWISKLEHHVEADDVGLLSKSLNQGLKQLSGYTLESSKDDVIDNLVRFERIYTFEEQGVTRKRKVWYTYAANWLLVIAYQGETVAEYDYWLPMGNYLFMTFDLPEVLWFATDRDTSRLIESAPPAEPAVKRGKPKQSGAA